ncbi:MAG TPA: polysaccharide deacetylase family protein [Desulfitobacteriaceae bacterium]|nr:polysaccharide deacetylase family protein [Desulfitobacteriaceae bacterium]
MKKFNFLIMILLGIMLGLLINGCSVLKNISGTSGSPGNNDQSDTASLGADNSPLAQDSPQYSEDIPVLYYHSVMVEPGNELRIPPEQFAAQIKYLSEHDYHVISLDQLYQFYCANGTLPKNPVVITFDDGYEDNYTNAYPVLEKYGYTATVFAVTSYIGSKGYMSWDQLQELQDKGWQIEGHTLSHPYLVKDKLGSAEVKRELREAKNILEKRLGRSVRFFAYPYGDYNADIVQEVKEAGYLMAFTTERGWANKNNLMLEHRVYCFADMGIEEFARRLQNPQY